jgi:hypothetical protein
MLADNICGLICLVEFVLRASSSFIGPVLIEDHGLLANLKFAIFEVAGPFVDVQDGTSRVLLCVDKTETAGDSAFSEQALAGPENYGKLFKKCGRAFTP